MCCLFTTLVLAGPRAAIIIWWLMEPVRWELAFGSFLVPLLGFLFLPITTIMYVLVAPGGVEGLDILWLGLAFGLDLFSAFGGAYGNKDRIQGAY
jgi:hypothetical protein